MSAGELHVERIFPVTFLPGPVLWGTVTGVIAEGDELVLERGDGTRVTGKVTAIDPHRPQHARADQFNVGVDGELASLVQVGDVVQKVERSTS